MEGFRDRNENSPRRDGFRREGGFRRGGGFRRSFDRGPRQMHKATCAKCKKECEVPFKPTEGGRPVYCNECWREQRMAA